jgi:sodium-dependent dicarboxylate transporter 2/3/5
MAQTPAPARRFRRLAALAAGPLAYLLLMRLAPDGLLPDQREVLGVAAWMVLWWLLEPVPLAVTSLLPVVLLPLNGVLGIRDVTAPYANEMILLFLAGFLIARALERWDAHTRLALGIVSRAGRSGRGIVLGFMAATALVSMFVSNTATAAMMYPMALAVGSLFGNGRDADRLRTALFLGLAYAASIGGMGTLLGTPPNLIFAAAARELTGTPVDFASWLPIGLPLVLVLLPAAWAILVFVLFRGDVTLDEPARDSVVARRLALGPLGGGELATLIVFFGTALAWTVRQPKELGALRIPGLQDWVPGITDASIGLAGAILLFVIAATGPDGKPRTLLRWSEAREIPWDVLLLFGGGLSLAAAIESSGLTQWLGAQLTVLADLSPVTILLVLVAGTVLLSELASNTAVAAMAMPLMAGLGVAADLPPVALMAAVALAASAGFALPIATPPNALVYGSGKVNARDMLWAGLLIDAVAIVAIVAAVRLSGFGT